MKPRKMQLCREDDGCYVICSLASFKPQKRHGIWFQTDSSGGYRQLDICRRDFERCFPHLKLKPGEGPRKIEITAKFVD